VNVAIYGAGNAGSGVAAILRRRPGVTVRGPFGRAQRERALGGGDDAVVIATTSFLHAVAPDVRRAVEAGANVLTTAEEAAYPWAADAGLASELDALARERGVTILGAGLNPGFAFDALVLTALGAVADVRALRVTRVVDLSGFSEAVLRRIGVGHAPDAFAAGVAGGTIVGHIGFAQSMRLVAARLGVAIDRIDRSLAPVVVAGRTAGFEQRDVALVAGAPWFEARFSGHVDPVAAGWEPRDAIHVDADPPVDLTVAPGLRSQAGSAAVIANSVRRLVDAPPGWCTVAELPPATPGPW